MITRRDAGGINQVRPNKALLIAAVGFLLSGCESNDYAKFYQPDPLDPTVLPYTGQPQVIHTDNLMTSVIRMNEEGYARVGVSRFSGTGDSDQHAIEQAKAVQASVVVIVQAYEKTKTGVDPVSSPTSATAYGSDGQVMTIYGHTTTYVPYSVDIYDNAALFYRPAPRTGDGLFVSPKTPENMRQQIGVNYGLVVAGVRRGSPAYNANILPNDVVLKVNDQPIETTDQLFSMLREQPGRTNKVTLWRLGQTIDIDLIVPASW